MTKVRMTVNLLAYRLAMRDALRQEVQSCIAGAPQSYATRPPFTQKHLLAPPSIGCISLENYLGRDDDYIVFMVSHDFGIRSMCVTILDEHGEVIESGEASPFREDPNGWDYSPQADVPPGTSVTVQITAVDNMGGIGRIWARKTMGEDPER